jgi:hypothetical protein
MEQAGDLPSGVSCSFLHVAYLQIKLNLHLVSFYELL